MESTHIIQSFQETLADLPPVEQALKALQFTEKIDELEASECERFRHHSVNMQQGGSVNIQRGGDSTPRLDEAAFPDPNQQGETVHQRAGRRVRAAEPQTNRLVLIGILAIAVLALIIAVITGVRMIFGGSKPVEPDDTNGTTIESGYDDAEGTSIESESDPSVGTSEGSEVSPSVGTSEGSEAGPSVGASEGSEADNAGPVEFGEKTDGGSGTDSTQD